MPRKKSAAKKAREAAKKAREAAKREQLQNQPTTTEEKKTIVQNKQVKPVSDSETDSDAESSENEDDFGELVTEEVEDGINKVLNAIKNNETDKLLDPKIKFFQEPEKAVANLQTSDKHKPIYLKDYHRMNLLAGNTFADDEDEDRMNHDDEDFTKTVDGKQSFVSQQREERQQLLAEINDAFKNDETEDKKENSSKDSDEDEDDFLTKKEPKQKTKTPALKLPDPSKDEEKFLEAFVSGQAWIPKKGDKVIPLDGEQENDEDEEEFDDAVEEFEHAYNFRYEDPNAAEIVSYARNQATLRRSANTSRRKKREEEKQEKKSENENREKKIHKKKEEKVQYKYTDVLEQLKKEYGADLDEKMIKKITETLLNSDFSADSWDQVVGDIFNEEFYDKEGKPTWDDDDELMAEFNAEQGANNDKEENDNKEVGDAEEAGDDDEEVGEDDEEVGNDDAREKQTRKGKKNEKKSKRKEKKDMSEIIEKTIQQNKLTIIEEVEKEEEERKSRSRTRDEDGLKFRYREVSPESYGLTAREIFAADDADLNQYIGLKKFAPYRPKELRDKDRRKVTKSKRLKEWRKSVFKNENGLADTGEISFPIDNNKKRHSGHHHSNKKHRNKKRRHDKCIYKH
ncbi:hypothetical protein TBLA_0A07760 [Henningerozyma blattae CBS 6284]|uniref:Kri1-like C-terminal domain-containing protein n=1 Tax=Henningerozyma blattae (strain ATCC 34711 / CBS 6284 / DSM 70876 / NBRC 10599 / NRRL Y-10934 / UCD 77-7) TaxID=1071380 RepID=I2GWR3_HENB6|nr:hypothetical protein TBLA_0A07760 [Tetrapisispora blattae CBS 6284]CCH58565.1 hypothetical protein TBLA_0A07760 [Tetrapisispora blattae CBS 6284]